MRPKYRNLLEAIGDTPLVKVPFEGDGEIYAKLEYLNPGGSIKDRSALFMIEDAEKSGALTPGGTIIEASSGNQGIAIAMIGAVKGYKSPSNNPLPTAGTGSVSSENRLSRDEQCLESLARSEKPICAGTASFGRNGVI